MGGGSRNTRMRKGWWYIPVAFTGSGTGRPPRTATGAKDGKVEVLKAGECKAKQGASEDEPCWLGTRTFYSSNKWSWTRRSIPGRRLQPKLIRGEERQRTEYKIVQVGKADSMHHAHEPIRPLLAPRRGCCRRCRFCLWVDDISSGSRSCLVVGRHHSPVRRSRSLGSIAIAIVAQVPLLLQRRGGRERHVGFAALGHADILYTVAVRCGMDRVSGMLGGEL